MTKRIKGQYIGFEGKTYIKYQGKEDDLQIACVTWFRLQYPNTLGFHVPNGGKRSKAEAGRFKAMGVLAGVSDFLILEPRIFDDKELAFCGLALELKVNGGKVSDYQIHFMSLAEMSHWKVNVIWCLDEFMDVVNDYLK